MKQPFLRVTNYRKHFISHVVTVPNFEVNDRITILKGGNGCGKSTILRSICRYISYEGSIEVNVSHAYMPDLFYFPKDIKVMDFINCHQEYYNYSNEKVADLILLFDLSEKMDEMIHTLSKGMKMKLNLIVTLARNCELFLLDEPLSGLDALTQDKLIDYINNDVKKYIITSHNDSCVSKLDGNVILLST